MEGIHQRRNTWKNEGEKGEGGGEKEGCRRIKKKIKTK